MKFGEKLRLTRRGKIAILVLVDSLLIILSVLASMRFIAPFVDMKTEFLTTIIGGVVYLLLYLFLGNLFRVFTRMNRYTGIREMFAIFLSTSSVFFIELSVAIFTEKIIYRYILFLAYILMTFLIIGSRLSWRLLVEWRQKPRMNEENTNVLIIGAGEAGRLLVGSLNHLKQSDHIQIVGILDDDANKVGVYLDGIKVIGTINSLVDVVKQYHVDNVVMAIPSISTQRLQEIAELAHQAKIQLNLVPSFEDIAEGKISISRLKKLDVVDLLGREEVQLDIEKIKEKITNQVILVTGAGGSIGSEICRQVMRFNPKQLLLLGHGENSIYLINRELTTQFAKHETEIIPIIADIQDRNRLIEVMTKYKPDIVYHAAAHKHVPLMEYNPVEALKNNIYGTRNVAEVAKACNVKQFVMISTDKANNPPNVMGATKRIAEMIVTGLNEPGKTKFSAVRFGNVLGSRGSVIPLFAEQIAKGGPITVTDFRMTRYFMTIPEASRLVIQSGVLAKGGEIFVLDMGNPVKILDLAKNMIRLSGYTEDEIAIVETGIRPGEKLYEELLLDKEKNEEQVYEKIFIGNIRGFDLDQVEQFLASLDLSNAANTAKQIIAFANESNK